MNDDRTYLDKAFLNEFLAGFDRDCHAVCTLMRAFPKENCYIFRFYDAAGRSEGYDDAERNTFSFAEFDNHYDAFHPEDEFGIYFYAPEQRIDSALAEMYTDRICIDSRDEADLNHLILCFNRFLQVWTELCYRENHPFLLTPQTCARFGLTPNDVAHLTDLIDTHNREARMKIRAEYDALRQLDFIRGEES